MKTLIKRHAATALQPFAIGILLLVVSRSGGLRGAMAAEDIASEIAKMVSNITKLQL